MTSITSCPDLYYEITANNTCGACKEPCALCSSLTMCITCHANFPFRYEGGCYASCPEISPLAINNVCETCATNCSACSSKAVCTRCTPPFKLINDGCVEECPT